MTTLIADPVAVDLTSQLNDQRRKVDFDSYDITASIWIGMGAGGLCYLFVMLKPLFGYDDALDAFGVHGIGGIWGALATGLFASKAINSAGADGLFFGNPSLLGIQALAVLISVVFAFIGTLIILAIVGAITGLRMKEEDERLGLDLSQHDEKAYS